MPIQLTAARVLKELDVQDIRILQMIETLMKEGQYAPVDKIVKYSGYHKKEVEMKLSKLHKLKLIERWKKHFTGYALKFAGFDSLALNALYNQKVISSVGMSVGVGKESDVYYALDFEENEILIKINRTGRTSFKNIRKTRDFLEDRRHHSIFFLALLASQREYEILEKLQDTKLPIPKVLGCNRHIIAMDIAYGIELVNVSSLKKPMKILKQIIKFAKKLYKRHNLVHGDLTEYNILYNEDKNAITIIDFPQALDSDHPEALNALERDFSHLLEFFGKKYGLGAEVDSVLEYIIK